MDVHDKKTRSYNMSQIKGKNTKPEEMVRKYLFAQGFRYRKNDKKLPGTPDIVLPKYKTVIFVNGCFWHGHKGCRYATKPKSNVEFWEAKIARNRHRDEVTEAHLHALGWHVITIWECELRGAASATSRLDALAEEIHKAGVALLERKALYKSNRLETQRKAREMKERQVLLEAEIDALYPIPKKVKMESRSEI